MDVRFAEPDYQLVWPRQLFVAEAAKLLNDRLLADWNTRCKILLADAFVGGYRGGPHSEFQTVADRSTTPRVTPGAKAPGLTEAQEFLRHLMQRGNDLREDPPPRRPYWSQRKAGRRTVDGSIALDLRATVRSFIELVDELETCGYLERTFGKNCADDPYGDRPATMIERDLGAPSLWPLPQNRLEDDEDLFCDIIEVLHDLVARPQAEATFHTWDECGRHHSDFDISSGRLVYRWRVNKLLGRSTLNVRIAEEGEDVGRLVAVTDDARTELVQSVVARDSNGETGDQVRHALALFRQRGADKHQKRSAVVALAGVLEERRRTVLDKYLTKGDRGALFQIANEFHIRHQGANQMSAYNDFFLDWIFWWYLSTIELTDRIVADQAGESRDSTR